MIDEFLPKLVPRVQFHLPHEPGDVAGVEERPLGVRQVGPTAAAYPQASWGAATGRLILVRNVTSAHWGSGAVWLWS